MNGCLVVAVMNYFLRCGKNTLANHTVSTLSDPARIVHRIVKKHVENLTTRTHNNDLVSGEPGTAQAATDLGPRQRHVRDIDITEALAGPFVRIHLLDRGLVLQIGTQKLRGLR
jgi:hypothetical protein